MSAKSSISSAAIIGAGMAGVSCAVALKGSVPEVKVFEKSAAAGGRMTARVRGQYRFECGAQYFTVRSSAFQKQVDRWQQEWLVDEWPAWIVDLNNGDALTRDDQVVRYVGRPLMHSSIEDMATACDVQYNTRVERVERQSDRWVLFDQDGNGLGVYDAVIVAVPAPQAVPLLAATPGLADTAAAVNMTPCWSAMLAYPESLQLGFDAAFVVTPKLSWIASNVNKPDRVDAECWVLHGSPEWSDSHLEMDPVEVVDVLMRDMEQVCDTVLPLPEYSDAKLWRYALPVNPLNSAFLYDENLKIGACGDWCYAARVEGAYLSGLSMAAMLLHHV